MNKFKFGATELQHFNWIFNVAPCFPVPAKNVKIITEPDEFYLNLVDKFQHAKRRISIASLYIGTGALERQLLKLTKVNVASNREIVFRALVDYQRGTRGVESSRSLLQEFVDDIPEGSRCSVAFYQTPRLRGLMAKVLPARWNELVGLQHMKLYIADDIVLLSGANCSNDYFTKRQDRYVMVEDRDLADFYSELIEEVSNFSRPYVKNNILERGPLSPHRDDRKFFVAHANGKIYGLISHWIKKQKEKIAESDKPIDTWIFPLIQMGEYQINQDAFTTNQILACVPPQSKLQLATGYFNITSEYADTLLEKCRAHTSLLMAHPNANGFLGAAGAAGGIPDAYSLIAKKFWNRVVKSNQQNRIKLLEYERPGWTFHAKGLWYFPAGSRSPWATLVGSANLGERSVTRDLEAQAAIFTTSPYLQEQLREESAKLHQYATESTKELNQRKPPLWVKAAVRLFRNYF